MKRILIVGAALTALALPAAAQAARTNQFGKLIGEPGATMKFKESNSADGHTVTAFTVRDFELGCSGGSLGLIKVAKLTGSISVSPGGSFRARDDNGRTVFNVKGQINRNKSFGTFRYSGRVETTTGSTRSCDTGKITWVTRP